LRGLKMFQKKSILEPALPNQETGTTRAGRGAKMALPGPAATRAAVRLCRIAASASSYLPSAAADGRRELELPFALVAERGMVVGGHRGMGMNAVGAPPGARFGAARERENTLLSFGRAAAHAAVAFVEFDVQVRLAVSFGTLFGFGLEFAVTPPQHCDAKMVLKNVGGWARRNNRNACSGGCNLRLPPTSMTILPPPVGTWMCSVGVSYGCSVLLAYAKV
jgi:hypothetical protein